jgi:hypothetical protein
MFNARIFFHICQNNRRINLTPLPALNRIERMMLLVAVIIAEAIEPFAGARRSSKHPPSEKAHAPIVRLVGIALGIAAFVFMSRLGK